jgi:hypothetical protein
LGILCDISDHSNAIKTAITIAKKMNNFWELKMANNAIGIITKELMILLRVLSVGSR